MSVYAFKNHQSHLYIADAQTVMVIENDAGDVGEIVALRERDSIPKHLRSQATWAITRDELDRIVCQIRPASGYMAVIHSRQAGRFIKFETGSRTELTKFADFVAKKVGCSSTERPVGFFEASPEFTLAAGFFALLTPVGYYAATMLPPDAPARVRGGFRAHFTTNMLAGLGPIGTLLLGGGGVVVCLMIVGWHNMEGYRIRTLRPLPEVSAAADDEGEPEEGDDSPPWGGFPMEE